MVWLVQWGEDGVELAMKSLRVALMFWIAGAVWGMAEEVRLDPEVVDRDFEVTVDVATDEGGGTFLVVGNLYEGVVRVPIVLGDGVDYVVEVIAPTYKRNSATVLKGAVEVRVWNPDKLVDKGEAGSEPLRILNCHRAIDWKKPGVLNILESKKLTISLTLVAVKESDADASGEVGEASAE